VRLDDLEHIANDIDRFSLGLVIRPRLHLGKQAERDQLDAGEDQQDAEQQQRPIPDPLVMEVRRE
jgi:hypothetical protein